VTSALGDNERDLLRQMVRQVLADVVPQTMSLASSDDVSISSDADLQAFARRIASATQSERDAIVAGSRTFRLTGGGPQQGSAPAVPTSAVVRVDKGAVTERHVRQAADSGAVLVLGKRAVLTPLARDRARAAGVKITKET
jgi:hypothetical protein